MPLFNPLAKDGWISVADSWAYASADAPTFTITVPAGAASLYSAGMRIKLTQTTVKYFIITAVADTVLTVYGGTDYTLANAAISEIYYSTQKAPLGFPLNPALWTVKVTDETNRTQASPVNGTWYNVGSLSITIPIGIWRTRFQVLTYASRTTESAAAAWTTLSTANNSESDTELTIESNFTVGQSGTSTIDSVGGGVTGFREKYISLASKTTYYINVKVDQASITSILLVNANIPLIIEATCVYL